MENKNKNEGINLIEVLDKLGIKKGENESFDGIINLLKHVLGPKLKELILNRLDDTKNKFVSSVLFSAAPEFKNIRDNANENEKLSYFSELAKKIKTEKNDSVESWHRTAICTALYMDAIAKLGKHYEDKLTKVGLGNISRALEKVLNCKDTAIGTSYKFAFLVIIRDLFLTENTSHKYSSIRDNAINLINTKLKDEFPDGKLNNEKFRSEIRKIFTQDAVNRELKEAGADQNNLLKTLEETIPQNKETENLVNFLISSGIPYDEEDLEKILDDTLEISEKQEIVSRIFSQNLQNVNKKEKTPDKTEEIKNLFYDRFSKLVENYTEKTIGDGDCFYWALVNILKLEKKLENMIALKEALLYFYNTLLKDKKAIGTLSEKKDFSWVEAHGGAILLAKFIKLKNVNEVLERYGIKKGTYKLPNAPVIVFCGFIDSKGVPYYSSIIAYGDEAKELEVFPSLEELKNAFRTGTIIVLDNNHYQNLKPELSPNSRQNFLHDFLLIELGYEFYKLEKCKDKKDLSDALNIEKIAEVLGEENLAAFWGEIYHVFDCNLGKKKLHEILEKYKNMAKEYIKEYIKEPIMKDSSETLSQIKRTSPHKSEESKRMGIGIETPSGKLVGDKELKKIMAELGIETPSGKSVGDKELKKIMADLGIPLDKFENVDLEGLIEKAKNISKDHIDKVRKSNSMGTLKIVLLTALERKKDRLMKSLDYCFKELKRYGYRFTNGIFDVIKDENTKKILGEALGRENLTEFKSELNRIFYEENEKLGKEKLQETLEKYENMAKKCVVDNFNIVVNNFTIEESIMKDSREILSQIKRISPPKSQVEKGNKQEKKVNKDK